MPTVAAFFPGLSNRSPPHIAPPPGLPFSPFPFTPAPTLNMCAALAPIDTHSPTLAPMPASPQVLPAADQAAAPTGPDGRKALQLSARPSHGGAIAGVAQASAAGGKQGKRKRSNAAAAKPADDEDADAAPELLSASARVYGASVTGYVKVRSTLGGGEGHGCAMHNIGATGRPPAWLPQAVSSSGLSLSVEQPTHALPFSTPLVLFYLETSQCLDRHFCHRRCPPAASS
eukprot:235489-Chlamydomonas_euryale.AAC.3